MVPLVTNHGHPGLINPWLINMRCPCFSGEWGVITIGGEHPLGATARDYRLALLQDDSVREPGEARQQVGADHRRGDGLAARQQVPCLPKGKNSAALQGKLGGFRGQTRWLICKCVCVCVCVVCSSCFVACDFLSNQLVHLHICFFLTTSGLICISVKQKQRCMARSSLKQVGAKGLNDQKCPIKQIHQLWCQSVCVKIGVPTPIHCWCPFRFVF